MVKIDTFERQYQELGIHSQRLYPNEELLRFLGRNYFSLPREARGEIRVLDIGCGSGANLWMLAKEGFQAYGLDSSPTGLAICRTHLRDKWGVSAKLEQGDFSALPFVTDFFDAVVDVVSLQHSDLATKAKAFREIFRALKPDGKFFSYCLGTQSDNFESINVPMIDSNTVAQISNGNISLGIDTPTCFMEPERMIEMLSNAGFVDIGVEIVNKTYGNRTSNLEYLVVSSCKRDR